jgi:hypothetical protein
MMDAEIPQPSLQLWHLLLLRLLLLLSLLLKYQRHRQMNVWL